VVVGIIAILATLLVLGIGHIMGGSKKNSTQVTLQALQGMLGEFDAKTRFAKQPVKWMWWDNGSLMTPAGGGGLDYWRIPFSSTVQSFRNPDALDAPGLVDEGAVVERNASRAVLNTQLAMGLLLSIPSNRDALQKTSADRYFIPTFVGGTILGPGNDAVLHSNDDSGNQTVTYVQGNRIQFEGKRYICIDQNPVQQGSMPASGSTPPTGSWAPDNTPAVPIMLDAWNNPIIFVPATGLRVRLLNGAKTYGTPDSSGKYTGIPTEVTTQIIASPEGKVVVDTSSQQPKVTQAGRPFWASAGPDGDFAKGDDNIYSFEK
jgi:hypothetical protein